MVSLATVGAVGSLLVHSTEPSTSTAIARVLTECSDYASAQCPGNGGHGCWIERGGGISFEHKTLHCQQGGGVAAIVYNNRDGYIGGDWPSRHSLEKESGG